VHLRAETGELLEHDLAAGHDGEGVPVVDHRARGRVGDRAAVPHPLHQEPGIGDGALDLVHAQASGSEAGHPDGAHVPLRVRRGDTGLGRHLPGQLDLELPGRLPEVHAHELRGENREVVDERGGPDQVGDGVGHRDLVGHAGPLGGVERKSMNGLGGRADDRGLGEGARQKAGRGTGVVAE
jgi:hypothetical protein